LSKPKTLAFIFLASLIVGLGSLAWLGSGEAPAERQKKAVPVAKPSLDAEDKSLSALFRAMDIRERGFNEIARELELDSLGGGTVSLSDYRGRVVLVNFWATW
jgi:thiol-disulfide isomerase/thioredoxin